MEDLQSNTPNSQSGPTNIQEEAHFIVDAHLNGRFKELNLIEHAPDGKLSRRRYSEDRAASALCDAL